MLNECDIKIDEKNLRSKHCKIVAFDSSLGGDITVPKKAPPKSDRRKGDPSKIGAKKRRKEEKKKGEGIKREQDDSDKK